MADYSGLAGPGPGTSSPDAPVNLGVEFEVTTTAWLKAIRFWRADLDQDGAILCRLWQVASASTGSPVADSDGTYTLSGTGWQTYLYPTPLPLTVGQRYRAACLFPSGYSATGGWYGAGGAGESGHTSGPLYIPPAAAATGAFQGSFSYNSALEYPDNGGTGNYWVDVVVTDTDPAGEDHDPGDGTAALTLDTTGTGGKSTGGSQTEGLVLAASGAGVPVRIGAGVAVFALSTAGAGARSGQGAGAASLALAAVGTSVHAGAGQGTAGIGLSATGSTPGGDITVTAGPAHGRWSAHLGGSRWSAQEVTP